MILCSIDGCSKPKRNREWCGMHYERWRRHGDPLATLTAPDGEPANFLESVLRHSSGECIMWPYSKSSEGYGGIWRDGRTQLVHRIVCAAVNGNAPSREYEAAHSCGNGHLGCVAPKHLSWKTRAENAADRAVHGTLLSSGWRNKKNKNMPVENRP